MRKQEVAKVVIAAIFGCVLLGSKLAGPVNHCGNDAGSNACNRPQASSANKVPASAWMKDHFRYRDL